MCKYSDKYEPGQRINFIFNDAYSKTCWHCGIELPNPGNKLATYIGHKEISGMYGDVCMYDTPWICPNCGHNHIGQIVVCGSGAADALFTVVAVDAISEQLAD